MRRTSTGFVSQGFTLIELAVVIAIIGILAAVAIPRFADTTTAAEGALLKDGLSQLNSAMSIATANNSAAPTQFNQFVTNGSTALVPLTTGGPTPTATLNLSKFGPNASRGTVCNVSDTTISCPGVFTKYPSPKYTIDPSGVISLDLGPTGSTPAGSPAPST